MDNKEMVSKFIQNNKIKYISFSSVANGSNNFWYDDNGTLCPIPLSYKDTIEVLSGYCLNINHIYI